MAQITAKGSELAIKLSDHDNKKPYYDYELLEACSLIARHATTYNKLMEGYCNGHPAVQNPTVDMELAGRLQGKYEEWLDRRTAWIEKRIQELAKSIPGVRAVDFRGDPRGCTVVLFMDDERWETPYYEGVLVPGA